MSYKKENEKLKRQLQLAMAIVGEQANVSTYAKEIQAEIESLEDEEKLRQPYLSKEGRFTEFTEKLACLSKKYGVAVKSVGGVLTGDIKSISYSDDYYSKDLTPEVEWR